MIAHGLIVVISCYDVEHTIGGGLFTFDGRELSRIDRLSTTGIDTDGVRFARVLWSEHGRPCQIAIYDQTGLKKTFVVESASNPHDLRFDKDQLLLVATAENHVLWMDALTGCERKRWSPNEQPDSWHLNSLCRHNGHWIVSAFGRFEETKQWDKSGRPRSGLLLDLEVGTEVLGGLYAPHTPRFVDGNWLVCNSADGDILLIDPSSGEVVRKGCLGGWTRGLAVAEKVIFAGVSAGRKSMSSTQGSRLALIDRSTFEVIAQIDIPGREIYDVEFVPEALVQSLQRAASDVLAE
jgi:uncharacterized protein (TIGR03032 family)